MTETQDRSCNKSEIQVFPLYLSPLLCVFSQTLFWISSITTFELTLTSVCKNVMATGTAKYSSCTRGNYNDVQNNGSENLKY